MSDETFDGRVLGKQWQQLPMFMSAHEIQKSHFPNDFNAGYTSYDSEGDPRHQDYASEDDLWEHKRTEADLTDSGTNSHGRPRSLYENIAEEGVKSPVSLSDPEGRAGRYPLLFNGHHRVAVMAEADPDALMPVQHVKGLRETFNDRRA